MGEIMSTIFLPRRLPQWPAMRFAGTLSLGLLAAGSLTACTAASPPFGPPNALSLSDDHSEIIMAGPMRDGLSAQVKQMLEANPKVTAIKLESPGGSGNEGYKLALLVKEYHLATFSATLCASACTFVYMAGEPRFLANGGKLGFHSSSVNGVKSEEGNKFSQLLYQEAGVPQAFIDKALATPPSDGWFPTTEELMKSHVVTDIVPDPYFVPSRRKYWSSDEQLDTALKSDGTVAAVARLDPAGYKQIRDIYSDGARQGRGIAQIIAASRSLISEKLMPAYFRRAPDDVVLRFARVELEGLRYIERNDPGSCVTIAAPNASISEYSDKRLSAELNRQLDQVMTDLISTALLHPDHPEDDALNRRTAREFVKTAIATSPSIIKRIEAVKRDKHNQVLYCQALEAAVETVLDQPAETAARIIRGEQLKGD